MPGVAGGEGISHNCYTWDFFLMLQDKPGCCGRPGGGNPHGCYTWEPTQSGWDVGVPPGIAPIIQIGYTSIFGRPGSLVLLDSSPHRALDNLGENSNSPNVTFGFRRNPDIAGNGWSEGQKRVWLIAIDYRTVAGTARAGCKGDQRSKGPDNQSLEQTPMTLWRHKGKET